MIYSAGNMHPQGSSVIRSWLYATLVLTGVAIVAQQKQIQLVSMSMWIRSLASLSDLWIRHCGELWCRLKIPLRSCIAAAIRPATAALIWSLAWEFPYAVGVALKSGKKKKKKKNGTHLQIFHRKSWRYCKWVLPFFTAISQWHWTI